MFWKIKRYIYIQILFIIIKRCYKIKKLLLISLLIIILSLNQAKASELIQINDHIDTYITNYPIEILGVYNDEGPHSADLDLRGTSDKYPDFVIEAKVTYSSDTWNLNSLNTINLPTGFSQPTIEFVQVPMGGSDPIESRNVFVFVKSGGDERYKIRWEITGTASKSVFLTHIPQYSKRKWVGTKKGIVFKIKHKEMDPSDNPYDANNINIITRMDLLESILSNHSNGLVNLEYEIKEILLDDEALWNLECNEGFKDEVFNRAFAQAGIDDTNYKEIEWVWWTFYSQTVERAVCNIKSSGMGFFYNVPYHRVGFIAQYSSPSFINNLASHGTVLHELSHKLVGEGHCGTLICDSDSDKKTIDINEIFSTPDHVKEKIGVTKSCIRYTGNEIPSIMCGAPKYTPLEVARMGWFNGSNVELITESGIYDLYSTNYNNTFDQDKTYILKLVTDTLIGPRYVFILFPNYYYYINAESSLGMTQEEYRQYKLNGLLLTTTGALGSNNYNQRTGNRLDMHFYGFSYDNGGASRSIQLNKNLIPLREEINIKWDKDYYGTPYSTDISIKSLKRENNKIKVKITFNPSTVSEPVTKTKIRRVFDTFSRFRNKKSRISNDLLYWVIE